MTDATTPGRSHCGSRPAALVLAPHLLVAGDAFGLGLEDYLFHYDGIVSIEWAERVTGDLP